MTEAQADKVMEILDRNSVEYELYENYSGRCMYGATTTGIVCSLTQQEFKELMVEAFTDEAILDLEEGFLEEFQEEMFEEFEELHKNELFPPLKVDNMGLQYIHY